MFPSIDTLWNLLRMCHVICSLSFGILKKVIWKKHAYYLFIAGIETGMFKEIIALDMVTASIIPAKWLRPGLKRKWEIFYGKIYFSDLIQLFYFHSSKLQAIAAMFNFGLLHNTIVCYLLVSLVLENQKFLWQRKICFLAKN